MTDLQTELERWAKLEPSRCGLHQEKTHYLISLNGVPQSVGVELHSYTDLALIQAAVQAAIKSNGYGLILEWEPLASVTYEAQVYQTKGAMLFFKASGHAAALALLRAYCDAIEGDAR